MRSSYVVGQWVRRERFYGRRQLLQTLLEPKASSVTWLAGLRRVGKTSVLRQIEHLAFSGSTDLVPLYWDLEGTDDAAGLGEGLLDALYDAEDELLRIGVALEDLDADDPWTGLEELVRQLGAHGRRLLLLWDEAEALAGLPPTVRRQLAASLARFEGAVVIATSGPRLRSGASLHGSLAELTASRVETHYLGNLESNEATSLACQDQIPDSSRPVLETEDVAEIVARSGAHPYLIQMLAKRTVELGNVEAAWIDLHADRSIEYFHRINFDLLSEAQQSVLRKIAEGASFDAASLSSTLSFLEAVGTTRRAHDGRYEIANESFAEWLRSLRSWDAGHDTMNPR